MSIKVIQWVWDCSESTNGERLVLLAIADNAADDGTRAYPSIAEIARKANLSERAVHYAIERLTKLGELVVKRGSGRGRVNMYSVIMAPCDRLKTPQNLHPSDAPDDPERVQSATERVQFDAGKGADSAPGTVPEPSKEPSGSSSDADASPNAGLIVKGFIDWLAGREEPVKLTSSVIARLGKEIKSCLKDGIDEGTVKRALVEMARRGKAGWPSMLQSFVVEVQNRPVSAPPAGPRVPQFKSAAEQQIDRAKVRKARARVLDALMEQGRTFDEAKAEIEGLTDEDFLKLVAPSTATGYIEGDVINEQRPEVES